jgi:hypothetical protein
MQHGNYDLPRIERGRLHHWLKSDGRVLLHRRTSVQYVVCRREASSGGGGRHAHPVARHVPSGDDSDLRSRPANSALQAEPVAAAQAQCRPGRRRPRWSGWPDGGVNCTVLGRCERAGRFPTLVDPFTADERTSRRAWQDVTGANRQPSHKAIWVPLRHHFRR